MEQPSKPLQPPLYVAVKIRQFELKRAMLDQKSSPNIIFYQSYM